MEGAGWASVLAVLQVPELDKEKFIVEALTQGCYLLLYGYILQQLPLSQDINDELEAIGRLVFWTTKAKPRLDILQQNTWQQSCLLNSAVSAELFYIASLRSK